MIRKRLFEKGTNKIGTNGCAHDSDRYLTSLTAKHFIEKMVYCKHIHFEKDEPTDANEGTLCLSSHQERERSNFRCYW